MTGCPNIRETTNINIRIVVIIVIIIITIALIRCDGQPQCPLGDDEDGCQLPPEARYAMSLFNITIFIVIMMVISIIIIMVIVVIISSSITMYSTVIIVITQIRIINITL